jgi:diguanylate cyclase
MAGDVEMLLRGPTAFAVARKAMNEMELHNVWPTPLNFELWVHFVAAPESDLGREIARIINAGEPFTDNLSDELAAHYLPKAKLNEQIRDAGDALSRELASVSQAINSAKTSSEAYGRTLADAGKALDVAESPVALKATVETLSSATRRMAQENKALEQRLTESTDEVTRLREHLEQVRRDATTDGLTSLANRKAFDEELERACADSDEKGEALTLALLDIDHFKRFNDTWGHQTGDQVLRFVASVIGRTGAPPRFTARFGGEEFAVIFPRERAVAAYAALEDIRNEVSSRMLKRRSTNEDLGQITVSAGFAERRPGEAAHAILERADEALYASKRGGRNRTTRAGSIADAA